MKNFLKLVLILSESTYYLHHSMSDGSYSFNLRTFWFKTIKRTNENFTGRVTLILANNFITKCRLTMAFQHNFF